MFIGYRAANIELVGGGLRLKALAVIGWMLGVMFHVQGIPFGGSK